MKDQTDLMRSNLMSVASIVGLAMAAIFATAMFLVKPPDIEPGYFYFSLFVILGSLAFVGGISFLSIIKDPSSNLGDNFAFWISMVYFLCQLTFGPLILKLYDRRYYDDYGRAEWSQRDWTTFLTIHFVVLAVFVIIYLKHQMTVRKEEREIEEKLERERQRTSTV